MSPLIIFFFHRNKMALHLLLFFKIYLYFLLPPIHSFSQSTKKMPTGGGVWMCTFKFLHLVGGSATSCCWYTFFYFYFTRVNFPYRRSWCCIYFVIPPNHVARSPVVRKTPVAVELIVYICYTSGNGKAPPSFYTKAFVIWWINERDSKKKKKS